MIDSFSGEYRFLSNFYDASLTLVDLKFKTSEHAYQYLKTDNRAYAEMILGAATPGEAKRLARLAPLSPTWEDDKSSVMYLVVWEKFRQNPDLAQKLLDTGDEELIEGNTWNDTYWGVCKGEGQNMLGKILMVVRQAIKVLGITNFHKLAYLD